MLDYIRSVIVTRKARMDQQGASAVEYGLLVALIAAVIVVVVLALGGILKEAFTDTCSEINKASGIDGSC